MSVFFTRRGKAPSLGKLASDYAVGESVFLMENGTAVEYLVVNQGIPSGSSLYDSSCDGAWLLRKEIYESRAWDSDSYNDYEDSTIHTYLNGDFLALLGADTQEKIKTVKLPYHRGAGDGGEVFSGSSGLSTQIFLLSVLELGWTANSSDVPDDGAKLDYFISGTTTSVNKKRIAYLNGTATGWWLRSPYTNDTGFVWSCGQNGNCGKYNCSASRGIRPALILDASAKFDSDTNIIK